MLIVEIGTAMQAFGRADRLASWVGICPGNHESAGKRQSGRIRKGNAATRRLQCELAHAASRTPSVFKSRFEALVIRREHKRAILAIGHKILKTVFHMLTRQLNAHEQFILNDPDNAFRVIRALKQRGRHTRDHQNPEWIGKVPVQTSKWNMFRAPRIRQTKDRNRKADLYSFFPSTGVLKST